MFSMFVAEFSCFSEAKYCYTHHTIYVDRVSVSVTKRCVAPEDCLSTGCTEMDQEGNKVGSIHITWREVREKRLCVYILSKMDTKDLTQYIAYCIWLDGN